MPSPAVRMAHGPTRSCRLCIEQYGPIKPPRAEEHPP
jgi:hypothetical protein